MRMDKSVEEVTVELRRIFGDVNGEGDRLDTIREIARALTRDSCTRMWLHDRARFGVGEDEAFESLLRPVLKDWRKEHHLDKDKHFDGLASDCALMGLLYHANRSYNNN